MNKKAILGLNTAFFIIIAFIMIVGIITVAKWPITSKVINKIQNLSSEGNQVTLTTSKGDIVIELYLREMPITAGNFKKLVEEGFYNNTIFHRVIPQFMIQGGDPTGTGMGGPGYKIKDEFTKTDLDKNIRGTIAMANAGPNTGGSQFFINVVDNNFLDGKHPIFGKVIKGMDIVDKIANVERSSSDKPLEDIIIIKAEIN